MNPNDEFWAWVHSHLSDNPFDLKLRWAGKYPWIDEAVMQIDCRRRTAKKLPEELKCRTFTFPTLLSAEQSTSDSLADFHASLFAGYGDVLDMTCGLGIDTFHIAASGCRVETVEIDSHVASTARYNADVLGLSGSVDVVCADSVEYVKSTEKRYDAVFVDPARRGAHGERVFGLSDCRPDIMEALPYIRNIARMLVVKMSPMLDITQTLRDLPGTTSLYVVGTSTECKELVAVVDLKAVDSEESVPSICVWTPECRFAFTLEEERTAEAVYAAPKEGGYLFEPYEVAMKAAPWRTLCARFGLSMLHPNSHLYCSDGMAEGFPGDTWRIEKVIPFASSALKRFARQHPVVNVAVRNFGWTADKLREKLRVKDGGDLRLMATTLNDGSKVMLLLSRP